MFGFRFGPWIPRLGVALADGCATYAMERERRRYERAGRGEEWERRRQGWWESLIVTAQNPSTIVLFVDEDELD